MDTEEENITSEKKSGGTAAITIVVLILIIIGAFILLSGKKGDSKQATEINKPTIEPTANAMRKTPPDVNESTAKKMTESIIVEGGNFFFKPNELRVKKGEKVTITFKNSGGFHNLEIDEFNVKTKTIKDGETETIIFTPDKTGSFEYYCGVGNHREMGMKGTLIVE